jgi:hypothetical protein
MMDVRVNLLAAIFGGGLGSLLCTNTTLSGIGRFWRHVQRSFPKK